MPVEIKELVIRAVTTMASEDKKKMASEEKNKLSQQNKPYDDQEAIIQTCVKQVLKILERKKER